MERLTEEIKADEKFLKKTSFNYQDLYELRGKILDDAILVEHEIAFLLSDFFVDIRHKKDVMDRSNLRNILMDFLMELDVFEKRKLLNLVSDNIPLNIPNKKIDRFFEIRNIIAHCNTIQIEGLEDATPLFFMKRTTPILRIDKDLFRDFLSLKNEIYDFLEKARLTLNLYNYQEDGN